MAASDSLASGYLGLVRSSSSAIALVAACSFVVGALGMAHAEPAHQSHQSGLVGEDPTLQRGGRTVQQLPKLVGIVNDARDITISDTSLTKGRYKIVVRDSTKRHNWRVYGPGVEKSTSVRGTGRWVWRVDLRRGTYTVVCDPHPTSMTFTFRVKNLG